MSPSREGRDDAHARAFDCLASARRPFGALAGTYTAVSACTNYPLRVKRAIPFKGHGASELAIAAALTGWSAER